MPTEYERGLQDAAAHKGRTEESWIRAAIGPFVVFGLPLALSYVYWRRISGPATKAMGGGKNPMADMMEMMMPIKKRQFRVDVKGTKFKDVIGIPEAKEEVKQYVEFLTNPTKFTRLGARLPKGCLLTGEPGTGKTLLAKAVAGEADVPFFSCSGADFIEVMGGSGPKRVRELFEEARAASPAIVFVDEIDAIGSRGGKSGGSVSSEENRTINQLLAELDGLNTTGDAIVVMAATNFQDNIDKALLREGRFDRKVNIEMPDLAARGELFLHYLNKVCTGDPTGRATDELGNKVESDGSVSNAALAKELADLTPGLSPATIATIVNEAALQSGVKEKKIVDRSELLEAIDNTQLGKKHRNRQTDESIRRTAIHEAGHALVAWMLPQQKNVLKISITPRGNAAGYTQRAGHEYHEYQTNSTLFCDMVVMMGGRAAEEVVIGSVSAGAMDDLQRATDMAMKKLMAFGMSERVGLLAYSPDSTGQGRSFVKFSEDSQNAVEKEAERLVTAAYARAKTMIAEHKGKIDSLVQELTATKELVTKDIERIWGPRPTEPTNDQITKELEALNRAA
jgi:ATP-dependent metalloprotease FtsH